MNQYITHSAEETRKLAKKLVPRLKGIIALTGPLGAGKTTFVQGFAQGLGIKKKIISPTFVLIRQHQVPNSKLTLFHVDLYRLEGEKDVEALGLKELLPNPNNIILIEWAEKIKDKLPKKTIYISFEYVDHSERKITIH